MKKLGKNLSTVCETVEAFSCLCLCYCYCMGPSMSKTSNNNYNVGHNRGNYR